MKTTLLSTALLIGSFAVTSFAAEGKLTGDLKAGWDNYYSNNNVVASKYLAGDGVTSFGADLRYSTPGAADIVASFQGSNLSTPSQSWLGLEDESSFYIGAQGEAVEGLTTSIGYNLVRGGMPGLFSELNKMTETGRGDTGCELDHSLRGDAIYEFKDTGWYVTGSAAYSFHGAEGWQMSFGGGYVWTATDRVSVNLYGNVSFSQDYMSSVENGKSVDYNGTDGYSITLSAPIKATETVTITPYIAAVWAGHNALAFNKSMDRTGIFKSFSPIVGINAVWSF